MNANGYLRGLFDPDHLNKLNLLDSSECRLEECK